MTISDYFHEFTNNFIPEWWCKFTWGISCRPGDDWNEWNWLDFTLGELVFTIILISIFFSIFKKKEDTGEPEED